MNITVDDLCRRDFKNETGIQFQYTEVHELAFEVSQLNDSDSTVFAKLISLQTKSIIKIKLNITPNLSSKTCLKTIYEVHIYPK